MPNQANDPTSPTCGNWSGNLVHQPPKDGENYYFRPTNLADLKAVLAAAQPKGVTLRVSGQRHSEAPLVADDNRGTASPALTTYLVDMSCYADLGSGTDQIVLGPGQKQVTVNPGVKEDALDAFLTNHKLMLDAVTAGGFFGIGGMTAVDVHGGTVEAPIFAEAVASFAILGARERGRRRQSRQRISSRSNEANEVNGGHAGRARRGRAPRGLIVGAVAICKRLSAAWPLAHRERTNDQQPAASRPAPGGPGSRPPVGGPQDPLASLAPLLRGEIRCLDGLGLPAAMASVSLPRWPRSPRLDRAGLHPA